MGHQSTAEGLGPEGEGRSQTVETLVLAVTSLVDQHRSWKPRRAGNPCRAEDMGRGQRRGGPGGRQAAARRTPVLWGSIVWSAHRGPARAPVNEHQPFLTSSGAAERRPREWQSMLCPSGGFVQTPEFQKPQRGCPGLSVSCRGPLTVGTVGSGPFCISHNKQTSERPFQGSMDVSCKTISY